MPNEEDVYLNAEQTIWLISEVRDNLIETILGNEKHLINLEGNMERTLLRLRELKDQKKAKKPKAEKKTLKGCQLTPTG
jgi:hypothetical protein